jgi:hypothetical protein
LPSSAYLPTDQATRCIPANNRLAPPTTVHTVDYKFNM